MSKPVEPFAPPLGRTAALGATTALTHGFEVPAIHGELGDDTLADAGARGQVPGLASGSSLGRYVIVQTLGAGGMGTVYEARDPDLERPVAIKVLRGAVNEEARLRMEREARSLARLSHPNVVQVYEIGRADAGTFIAMELVRGQSLDAWQRARPAWRECVRVYLQAGRGLSAAHAEGLVHRDFKPSNCILGDDGRVRVLDFGLARQQGPLETSGETSADGEPDRSVEVDALTRTGSFMGTPAYTPLAQFQGQPADAATDQFAFCVALHEAIHGERPFEGRSVEELTRTLTREEIRASPLDRRLPKALRRALRRGLARDSAARWPSMDALLAALERLIRPRGRVSALLVGTGLLVVGGGLWQHARTAAPSCGGATEALVGVWDPARRAEVEAAISGTALPYAAATAASVVERLDDYAATWATLHEDTCEATHVRHEQTEDTMSLRMICLGSRKLALREVVGVLAHVDAASIEHASNVVSSLPSLARCEDVEALRAAVPPPDDPDRAARVEALRPRLARARALEAAGRYDPALEQLDALRSEAEAIAYAPLRAEVEYWRGAVLQARGEPEPAVPVLERAFGLALEHGYDEVATDAASLLVFVVGVQQGQLLLGKQWGTTALALARRQRDPSVEATALLHVGMVERLQGDLELALAHTREALAIKERLLGPEHPHVAFALAALAAVLEERDESTEALAVLRRALAIDERVLGPEHPHVATSVGNIGRVLTQQGALDDAIVHLERARAIYERVGDRPSLAAVLSSLAHVRYQQGNLREAAVLLQQALEQAERELGAEHLDVATIVGNLSNVLHEQGQVHEAVVLQRRTLAIREAALGPDHHAVADAADNLGLMLREAGARDEAVTLHRRALAIRERIHGPVHPDVAGSAFELGMALDEQGQRVEARRQVERALEIYAALPQEQELAAEARTWLDGPPGDELPR